MSTTFASHLTKGIHSARPAATAVPAGSLYSCSTHGLIYQSDGSSWSTYATLGGTAFGAWTDYTPALTAAGGNPALGTGGTIAGRYRTVGTDGIEGVVHILFGSSGVSAGSGEYNVSVPSGITLPSTPNTNDTYGSAWSYDSSAGIIRNHTVARADNTKLRLYVEGAAILTNASPWAWAAGDVLNLRFAGECAIA